jgi:hypothetical protein
MKRFYEFTFNFRKVLFLLKSFVFEINVAVSFIYDVFLFIVK